MITHQPGVVGLTVCRDITRDPSGDLTITRSFTGMVVPNFPATVSPFCLLVTLTDGGGDGLLGYVISKLDEPVVELPRRWYPIAFPDRLQIVECAIRIHDCAFPTAGLYTITFFLDHELLAQKTIRIHLRRLHND